MNGSRARPSGARLALGARLVWLVGLAACEPLSLDAFLYDPLAAPTDGYKLSHTVIPHYEDLGIRTPDGIKLHAVFIPSPGPRADVTLLYFHGQSNNIGTTWKRAELLYPLGYNLVMIDPRGYGRSGGTPSETGIQVDERAVLAFIAQRSDVDAKKLVYYGHSFGGALAIDLASTGAPAVLVTESTFTSIADLVKDGAYADLPRSFVAKSSWDSLKKVGGIQTPYLILHGTADSYVQVAYAGRLAAAHAGRHQVILVPGAGHSNLPEAMGPDTYRAALAAFVDGVLPTP